MKRKNNEEENPKNGQENPGTEEPAAPNSASGPYSEMLRIASQLPNAYRTGAGIDESYVRITNTPRFGETYYTGVQRYPRAVPGIMILDWVPTLGVARNATDAVNMAAKAQYSYIRSVNSGARNYEASDLVIYELALDSLYSWYYSMLRVYGIINIYQPLNAYYPKAILGAMGWDYDDLVRNQAQFAFFINNFKAKLKEYALPTTMRLFKDHLLLNSAIYTDGDTIKSQAYIFDQKFFYSYEQVDTVKGLKLAAVAGDEHPFKTRTFNDIVAFSSRLLTAFLDSSDVAIISGDVLKAYGDSSISVLPDFDYGYTAPIVKDEMMLLSINNASILAVDFDSVIARDDTNGNLRCEPKFTGGSNVTHALDTAEIFSNTGTYAGSVGSLSFRSDSPTPEEVAAAARFYIPIKDLEVTFYEDAVQAIATGEFHNCVYKVASCGTEIIHGARVVNFEYGATQMPLPEVLDGAYMVGEPNKNDIYGFPFLTYNPSMVLSRKDDEPEEFMLVANYVDYVLALLARFDWHPPVCKFYNVISQVQPIVSPASGVRASATTPFYRDVQNCIPVDDNNIALIHTAGLFQAFFE